MRFLHTWRNVEHKVLRLTEHRTSSPNILPLKVIKIEAIQTWTLNSLSCISFVRFHPLGQVELTQNPTEINFPRHISCRGVLGSSSPDLSCVLELSTNFCWVWHRLGFWTDAGLELLGLRPSFSGAGAPLISWWMWLLVKTWLILLREASIK